MYSTAINCRAFSNINLSAVGNERINGSPSLTCVSFQNVTNCLLLNMALENLVLMYDSGV